MRPFLSIFCLLYLTMNSYAQSVKQVDDAFVWERYTQAWVECDATYRDILNKADTNKELTRSKTNDVRLFIPKKPNLTMANGNKYIRSYLINNTKDSIVVNRTDASISDVRTEIKVGKEWKLFQINTSSSCGNSYFKSKLGPGNYLSLKVEDRTPGSIKVPYRMIIYINERPITSNETNIYVTPELIALAGKPIRRTSL